MKKKNKEVPFKNYLILLFLLIGVICCLCYFNEWYKIYKAEKLKEPVMTNFLSEIKYEEISNYINEARFLILYVSKSDDEKTKIFEKQLRRQLRKKSLQEEVLYLNTFELELEKEKIINDYDYDFISDIPNITVFEYGKIKKIYKVKKFDVNATIKFIENKLKEELEYE